MISDEEEETATGEEERAWTLAGSSYGRTSHFFGQAHQTKKWKVGSEHTFYQIDNLMQLFDQKLSERKSSG